MIENSEIEIHVKFSGDNNIFYLQKNFKHNATFKSIQLHLDCLLNFTTINALYQELYIFFLLMKI